MAYKPTLIMRAKREQPTFSEALKQSLGRALGEGIVQLPLMVGGQFLKTAGEEGGGIWQAVRPDEDVARWREGQEATIGETKGRTEYYGAMGKEAGARTAMMKAALPYEGQRAEGEAKFSAIRAPLAKYEAETGRYSAETGRKSVEAGERASVRNAQIAMSELALRDTQFRAEMELRQRVRAGARGPSLARMKFEVDLAKNTQNEFQRHKEVMAAAKTGQGTMEINGVSYNMAVETEREAAIRASSAGVLVAEAALRRYAPALYQDVARNILQNGINSGLYTPDEIAAVQNGKVSPLGLVTGSIGKKSGVVPGAGGVGKTPLGEGAFPVAPGPGKTVRDWQDEQAKAKADADAKAAGLRAGQVLRNKLDRLRATQAGIDYAEKDAPKPTGVASWLPQEPAVNPVLKGKTAFEIKALEEKAKALGIE